METIPERLEPGSDRLELRTVDVLMPEPPTLDPPVVRRVRRPARPRPGRRTLLSRDLLWVLSIYLAARLVLLVAAFLNARFGHFNFLHELANWDGLWYREVANQGYPSHTSYLQTTLGFFPLFPLSIWLLEPIFTTFTSHDQIWAATVSGALISGVGGAVATCYVYRLAESWWDRVVARRAAVLFILFPGSVVFSLVYSEGLLLPLAAACLYALQRHRWVQAGILAGFATAVQPAAVVLVPVCAISALLELRRSGWTPAALRRVAPAPLLSLAGLGAFAIFLWAWTGSPFANYQAQHHGWSEKTDPLAIVHLTTRLAKQISFSHFNQPTINLNLVVGLFGAVALLGMLVLVFRQRRRIPVEAIVWTAGISFLALTSEYVPPNPRMLITAFPALMVLARYVHGRMWTVLVWVNALLLVGLSVLTFHGVTLRP